MIYIISFVLIIISYYIGKSIGKVEGESRTEDTLYYLYEPQIDLYDKGYKKGVLDTKEKDPYWKIKNEQLNQKKGNSKHKPTKINHIKRSNRLANIKIKKKKSQQLLAFNL